MEPININHAQIISSTINSSRSVSEPDTPLVFTSADQTIKAPSEVVISPLASAISDLNLKSRFTSYEDLSAHKTKLFEQTLTTEEIQNGTRRPFASAEDERLSHLTLKELMDEGKKLPALMIKATH